MPSVAICLPSIAMKACNHSMAASPASIIFCSICLTGGNENGTKNGAVKGASQRSVKGESIAQGSAAPNMRGT